MTRKRYRFPDREAAEAAELAACGRADVLERFFLAPRPAIKWFRKGPCRLAVLEPGNAVDGYAVTIWHQRGQKPQIDLVGTLQAVYERLQRVGDADWRRLAYNAAAWAYQQRQKVKQV